MHLAFTDYDFGSGGVGHNEQEAALEIGLDLLDLRQVNAHIATGAKKRSSASAASSSFYW